MNALVVNFLCPTASLAPTNGSEITFLSQRGIRNSVCAYSEDLSQICIEAPVHSVIECFFLLKDTIVRSYEENTSEQANVVENCVMEFVLQSSTVARLIGTHGAAIEQLRKIAHCSIFITKDVNDTEEMSLVQLTGDVECIPQTFILLMMRIVAYNPMAGCSQTDGSRIKEINKQFEEESMTNATMYSKCLMSAINPTIAGITEQTPVIRLKDAANGKVVMTFSIASQQAGSIIGRGGERIRDIRNQTNTAVIVHKAEGKQTVRTVEVTGELSDVRAAAGMILSCLEPTD